MTALRSYCEDASLAYGAYGCDLIRTACALLMSSPAISYRAQVLFQRFNQAVDREIALRKSPAPPLTPATPGVVTVLADILLYPDVEAKALAILERHDDTILYFAAAAVLVTAKMEDSPIKIKQVVTVFDRINRRRRRDVMILAIHNNAALFDLFKANVIAAEEAMLIQLGFQTFVEYPYKFLPVFLSLIVDRTVSQESEELFLSWMSLACAWCNDAPRFAQLVLKYSAPTLAVAAISATKPVDISLPDKWHAAFGVDAKTLASLVDLHHTLTSTTVSSENVLALLEASIQARARIGQIAQLPPPPPPPPVAAPAAVEPEMVFEDLKRPSSLTTHHHQHSALPRVVVTETRGSNPPQAVSSVPIVEEFQDLKQLQKERREREKQAKLESERKEKERRDKTDPDRHRKRSRSGSEGSDRRHRRDKRDKDYRRRTPSRDRRDRRRHY